MPRTTHKTTTDRRCKVSELETRILHDLSALGIPIVPQVKLRSWVFDAAVQGTSILIEVNGRYWHGKPEVVERDNRKRQWCADHGYDLIVIEEERYEADPKRTVQAVARRCKDKLKIISSPDNLTRKKGKEKGDWSEPFLGSLAQRGNVRRACEDAGITRQMAYLRRESDEDFRAAWDDAIEDACDRLEEIARDRAEEQSDTLLIVLLKAHRPDKYREQSHVEHDGGLTIEVTYENPLSGDDEDDEFTWTETEGDDVDPD